MFGIILEQLLPLSWAISPGVYALVGATSVLGGVFRASISLVIIMVEGTRGIEFLFGVIVGVMVSNWVSEVGLFPAIGAFTCMDSLTTSAIVAAHPPQRGV